MQEVDKELIVKAGQGDMRAFREIYDKTSGYVYALAFRVTNRKPDAEEVTQDVFFRIYRSLSSFKFEASFKTWAYRVTMNAALNHVKRQNRIASREVEDENGVPEAVFIPHATKDLEREENDRKLKELLDQLSPAHRACIVLREIEGMDYQAMAEVLGINLNTVRSRLKRAREALMELGKAEVIHHGL